MHTTEPDADDGFQRWWLGGAPGADDIEIAAAPDDRPIEAAPPPPMLAHQHRREGWVAAVGSMAAVALLWGFYGVVDGAVERNAQRLQMPGEALAAVTARAAEPRDVAAADVGAEADVDADADTMHAVYTLPARNAGGQGAASIHYTRWP